MSCDLTIPKVCRCYRGIAEMVAQNHNTSKCQWMKYWIYKCSDIQMYIYLFRYPDLKMCRYPNVTRINWAICIHLLAIACLKTSSMDFSWTCLTFLTSHTLMRLLWLFTINWTLMTLMNQSFCIMCDWLTDIHAIMLEILLHYRI